MLRALVQRLLIDDAVSGIELSQQQTNQAMSGFLQQQKIKDQNELNQHCSLNGIQEEELIQQVGLPLKIAMLSIKEFGPKAEAHFLKRKEDLDQVRYSLIRVQDPGMAHELYLQIEAGEADFDLLAEEHSQGPEKQSRGQIGLSSLSRAHPLLRNRLRTATAGVTLEPFQIEQWWVVARLDERRSSQFDEAMNQRMATELFNLWVEQATNNIMDAVSQTLTPAGTVA